MVHKNVFGSYMAISWIRLLLERWNENWLLALGPGNLDIQSVLSQVLSILNGVQKCVPVSDLVFAF